MNEKIIRKTLIENKDRWEKCYSCSCGTEIIHITRWYDPPQICFALYYISSHRRTWRDLLRHCWHILKEREPYPDAVILDIITAKRLALDLMEMVRE